MTRSTFQREPPEPLGEALTDVRHWAWALRLQLRRFVSAIASELKALRSGRTSRSTRRFSRTTFEEHLVYVSAANLQKAIERLPNKVRRTLPAGQVRSDALKLLRDVYEHWDQLRAEYRKGEPIRGAAGRLHRQFPSAVPWQFSVSVETGRVSMANVIQVDALATEVGQLEAAVREIERLRQAEKNKSAG